MRRNPLHDIDELRQQQARVAERVGSLEAQLRSDNPTLGSTMASSTRVSILADGRQIYLEYNPARDPASLAVVMPQPDDIDTPLLVSSIGSRVFSDRGDGSTAGATEVHHGPAKFVTLDSTKWAHALVGGTGQVSFVLGAGTGSGSGFLPIKRPEGASQLLQAAIYFDMTGATGGFTVLALNAVDAQLGTITAIDYQTSTVSTSPYGFTGGSGAGFPYDLGDDETIELSFTGAVNSAGLTMYGFRGVWV